MLMLVIIFIACLTAATVYGAKLVSLLSLHRRLETASDAASLAAARELSRVVVADPNFGYISLSDYAPGSREFVAADGKPLPVTGINTLIATARASMLMAGRLNNEEYLRLARVDAARTRQAVRRLISALKLAVQDDPRGPKAADGKVVKPMAAARQAFVRSFGGDSLRELKLELGYLSAAGSTATAMPLPLDQCRLPATGGNGANYAAFVDLPVAGESFIFADLAPQPRLVSSDLFIADVGPAMTRREIEDFQDTESSSPSADAERVMPASVVRVRASVKEVDICGNSCAAPYALADRSAPGVLLVGLPDGLPGGYLSFFDYTSDRRCRSAIMPVFRARGGDYPLDSEARLAEDDRRPLSDIFVQGLYDWVRTAHGRIDMDRIMAVLGSRMQPTGGALKPGQTLVYRFQDGDVLVDFCNIGDVQNQIVQDGQSYSLGLSALPATGAAWTVAFRDQVRRIGLREGGKHGGQAMDMGGCLSSGGVVPGRRSGSRDAAQRDTYFDGGLAVEIVISTPQSI